MPTYQVDVGDKTYEVDAPDPNTAWQWANYTHAQPAPKTAGFSLKDLGISFGQGAVGSTEAITNVAGAGNAASQYLGDVNERLSKQYTPERQAELLRQQERMKKAEQSGSTLEELKAGVQNIAEAPLQSIAQGVGSFVPYIPAIFGGPVAAALGLSERAVVAANLVAKAYAPVVGTAQGAGSVKGAIYDAVYKAEKETGLSEPEARQKADAAQEYTGQNLDQIALGAGLGYIASKGGIEKYFTKEGREQAGQALLPRVGTAIAEESVTEGAQGGQERLASNLALQRTGKDVPTFQGVAGQAFQEGLIGGLTAGPISAFTGGKSKADVEQERLKKEQDQFAEQEKAFVAQQAKTRENLQVPEMLALPPPSQRIEPVKEEKALTNPLGNITKDELGPEVSGYVEQHRQQNNLPQLQSYSIEDVRDAMTQVNPEGEKGALNSILTAKTGYSGEEKYAPQDVVNAAIEKNVAYETVGFQDYLQRTTGERDLNTMSQPQLYSAFKALSEMKRESGQQIVLPEGSNASRFTQDQYDKGRSFVAQQLATGEPLAASPAREALKDVTGLKTDRDVHTLLQTVIKNEDLNVAKVGDDFQITSSTPIKDARAPLPKGYSIEEGTYAEGERPAGFEITPEGRGKPLTTVDLEEEVAPKIERLTGLRQQEAAKMLADVNKYSGVVKAGQTSLDSMEARGLTGTEAYAKEKANQARREDVLSKRITTLMNRIEEMSAPLKSKPVGTKPIITKKSTLSKDGKVLGTFPSRLDAEASMLTQLTDAELDTLATDTRFGGITDRAVQEQERRKAPPGMRVKGTEAGLAKAGVATKSTPEMAELEKNLVAALSKFGLKDVALKVVRAINENAEGSYEAKLIKIAFDAANPVRTLRHEAVHALKELGFFTKDQWRVLENKAKNEWVQKYLAGKTAVVDGEQMSRLDAYKKMGLSESEILEEAISDAFADFDVNKAPPGMMMALLNKLRNFFKALRQALTGAGFESAEDIFGKIEEGKLESQMDKADKAGDSIEKKQEKLSLYGEGVPLSTRGIMDRQTVIAQQELGLKTEAVRNRFNNVREIAIALNRHTKVNFGVMDPNALTRQDSTEIAKAIADEVAYQLRSTSKTGTGLGWYSNNYPKAVRRLAERFPELGSNEHAQSVFSALVAVTSNGEKVTKNIDNAIKLYAELRNGKPLVAMGNRRATALENNLVTIQNLLTEFGTDFKRVLLKEITVKEMNAKLREMGEEADGSYLADTVVPAAAVYFGPKLGAFYANLSGSEGYLTMDLWWTRSINRMRGLLMPKATEASISKFRDMMDQPSVTRDEVVAATIPLRNKYEEYGFMTELEHLVKSKEPAHKVKKDAWFAKAKRKASSAYQQLLFEHKLEKMANTIYKNEFEMLEEAPFTATDRKFMYDAARKAQQLLRNEGIDLTLADIQAALWYYEKRLYEKLSGRKADDIGYEEAIIAQAGKGNGRARPSVVFSEQSDGRNGPAEKIPVSEELRGESARGEKLSLREAPNTPEFKRWFGDSKVVDENGKPLVVYHGTAADFTEFNIEMSELGVHLGTKNQATDAGGGKPPKMALYASIKNPIRLVDYGQWDAANTWGQLIDLGVVKDRGDKISDYLVEKATREQGDKIVREALIEAGYDGIVYLNRREGLSKSDKKADESYYDLEATDNEVREAMPSAQDSYIAFSPTQIKSATGNIGTYDAANPDIRYSLRDATDMFDPDEVKKSAETQYKSRYKLINIDIDDFLRLAKTGKQDSKLSEATSRVKEGVKFTSIPYLYMDREGDNLRVTGHEGRHRAMALQQAGYSTMPVEIRSDIRWSEQTDPDRFDYRANWPKRILSEEGSANENFSIAMPFTREQAPEDYQVLQRPEAKFSLRDIKAEIESMPNGKQIFSAIKGATTTREEKGWAERITSFVAPRSFSQYRNLALDRYNQLSVYEKALAKENGGIERLADSNAHSASLMSDLHAGVTAQVLGVDDGVGGVPVFNKGYTSVSNLNGTVKGPMEIFKRLAAVGDPTIYQAYQFWAAAKRGKRLLGEGREQNIDTNGIAFAQALEDKYPMFVDIQKDWVKFNNGLVKYQIDTGVISKEMGQEWMKYADYIPFYRQLDGENTVGPKIYQSISGVKPSKKLKGSEAPLADFLETVVRNTHAAVQAGMKNVAAQRAGQLAVQVGIGERLDGPATGHDIITALENGKQVFYRIGDDLFVDAVTSLNIPELPFISFLTAPSNLLRNLVTKDPGFMLANLMRDSVSAYVTSGANIKP